MVGAWAPATAPGSVQSAARMSRRIVSVRDQEIDHGPYDATAHRASAVTALGAAERIARSRVARVEAAAEPRDALRRRAVREAFRVHPAGRHFLQPVVADGGGRVQPFLHVAWLEHLLLIRCM